METRTTNDRDMRDALDHYRHLARSLECECDEYVGFTCSIHEHRRKAERGLRALEAARGRERELQEDVDRLLSEAAVLREKVSKNADLYRRDVQHAVDLIEDAKKGKVRLDDFFGPVLKRLKEAHEAGREELENWREEGDDGGR